jgi:uncharacterized CHY-type Zn-finger protein
MLTIEEIEHYNCDLCGEDIEKYDKEFNEFKIDTFDNKHICGTCREKIYAWNFELITRYGE